MGVVGQRHAPAASPRPIVQEAGWAPGPDWTVAENLAPTGIRSPDRPARSESLHRLSHPGQLNHEALLLIPLAYFPSSPERLL